MRGGFCPLTWSSVGLSQKHFLGCFRGGLCGLWQHMWAQGLQAGGQYRNMSADWLWMAMLLFYLKPYLGADGNVLPHLHSSHRKSQLCGLLCLYFPLPALALSLELGCKCAQAPTPRLTLAVLGSGARLYPFLSVDLGIRLSDDTLCIHSFSPF